MYRVHTLPTKPTKDATTEEAGGRPTRSVEESLVLLQALRQSRQTWLTSAFVKFSTKSRTGKGSEIWQPPHTSRLRGKCDLEIGPHVFYSTSIYEVTYQAYQVPIQTPSYYAPTGQKLPGWATGPYTYTSTPQTPSAPKPSTAAQAYTPSTPAVISSLKGTVPLTNDLITHVNAAAVTNPTLAHLLGLAASGSATPEQLQTLGVTIQSLAETALKPTNSPTPARSASSTSTPSSKTPFTSKSQTPVPPPKFQPPTSTQSRKPSASTTSQPPVLSLRPSQASPNTTPGQQGEDNGPAPATQKTFQLPQMQTINKEPDVVIEFYENQSDRWILPKDLVLYERVRRWDNNNNFADMIFSTVFPFEGSKSSPPSAQVLSTTAGSTIEPVQQNKDYVHPITLRFFNVPPAVWNLFSTAAGDEERTKRVEAAIDAQLDKAAPRTYLQHRIAEGALLTQLQASASDRYPTRPIRPTGSTGNTAHPKRRASAASKNSKEGSPAGAPPSKRKRTSQTKKLEPKMGQCEGCLRSPVALASDAPYCPTCEKVNKSKVSSVTPASVSTTLQTKKSISAKPKSTTQSMTSNGAAQPAQMQYGGGPPQTYYAWQNQPQYLYQYPLQMPQNPSTQPTFSGSTTSPVQPTSQQPSVQQTHTQQQAAPKQYPEPKKKDIPALE